jgi:hypothetical protein
VAALVGTLVWVVAVLPDRVAMRRATIASEPAPPEPTSDPTGPVAAVAEPAARLDGPAAPGPVEPVDAETTFSVESAPIPDAGADAFDAAMSRALVAIDMDDLTAARRAVEEAARLRGDDRAVADVRARIENAETGARLAALRAEASSLEDREDWSEAVRRYEEALALDGHVRFARVGLERARERLDLQRRLAYHAAHPERMAAADVRDEVEVLLEEAEEIRPQGPAHSASIRDVRAKLDAWSTPVRVVLESDDRTEVTVYRVGRLGAFERRELDLTPGSYTVVGVRDGFRDVRATLRVEPEGGLVRLRVLCTEEI